MTPGRILNEAHLHSFNLTKHSFPLLDLLANIKVISNWATLSDLCQAVNTIDGGAKEAARALRKKLRTGSPQQQLNSITFALVIDLVMVLEETSHGVKIRLMERLSVWSSSFSGDPSLEVIPQLYNKLVADNVMRNIRIPLATSVSRAPSFSSSPSVPRLMPNDVQKRTRILEDIELANNNAHMLIEAVAFADPELEAVEENALIKEFLSKCQTLRREMQIYLSELTSEATTDEKCLAALLSCNEELFLAINSYDQMMKRRAVWRAANTQGSAQRSQASISFVDSNGDDVTAAGAQGSSAPRQVPPGELVGKGKGVAISSSAAQDHIPSVDPFADDGYYVADLRIFLTLSRMTEN
ncbi:putative actin patch assembly and actin polymerization protein [Mortierella sp. GBA30]|nr:putative actin patch assembly and actin polymerization protein [Mortierella sp. GBA30]